MSWLRRLLRPTAALTTGMPIGEVDRDVRHVLWLYVRCASCGEVLRVRVNTNNDLTQDFDEHGSDSPVGYIFAKELIGSRCRTMMSVQVAFDTRRRPISQVAERCTFVTREAFEPAGQ